MELLRPKPLLAPPPAFLAPPPWPPCAPPPPRLGSSPARPRASLLAPPPSAAASSPCAAADAAAASAPAPWPPCTLTPPRMIRLRASPCRVKNVGDQQTEVSSQPERNPVEESNKKISPKMQSKEDSSDGDDTKEDYVHVRAKRGQATNSHSLAERLRRKKISERMKLLQDLVPGCSKITGKAVMLDEIINYVQSLQRQVEFLSMKLATVNPELAFDIEQILSKQMMLSQDRLLAFYGADPGSSTLVAHFNQGIIQPDMMCNVSNPVDVLQGTFHDVCTMNQIPEMWEGLQNIPHMNFNPGVAADSSTNNAGSMKIEQ